MGGELLPEAAPLVGALRGAAWTLGAARGADLDTAPEPCALDGALTVGCLTGALLAEPEVGGLMAGDLMVPELGARVVGAPPLVGARREGAEIELRPGATRVEGAAVPPLADALADGTEAVPARPDGGDPTVGVRLPLEAGALADGLLGAAVPVPDRAPGA